MARGESRVHLRGRRRIVVVVAALVLVAGYSYVASGTKPFTSGADAVTAAPFAAAAAIGLRSFLRRRGSQNHATGGGRRGQLLPWVVSVGALLTWELVTYVAGFPAGRHAFPTISSLADEAFRSRGAKAAAFAGWLGLGWGVVRR